jgi:hypothetical protein
LYPLRLAMAGDIGGLLLGRFHEPEMWSTASIEHDSQTKGIAGNSKHK